MKKLIRAEIIKLRNELTEIEVKSNMIFNKLISLDLLKPSMKVLSYMDFRNEVCTKEINEFILGSNMTLLLPRVDKKTKLLTIHKINNFQELVRSKYGILEPNSSLKVVNYSDIDFIIAPGVAFDNNCFRLGYGGGFYDKLLSNKRSDTLVAALAFDIQIIPNVPTEIHDIKVDYILTESQIFKKES